jgi:hypothetical protein
MTAAAALPGPSAIHVPDMTVYFRFPGSPELSRYFRALALRGTHRRQPKTSHAWVWGANGRRVSRGRFQRTSHLQKGTVRKIKYKLLHLICAWHNFVPCIPAQCRPALAELRKLISSQYFPRDAAPAKQAQAFDKTPDRTHAMIVRH